MLSALTCFLEVKRTPVSVEKSPVQCKQPLLCGAKVPEFELEQNDTTAEGMRHDTYEPFCLI